MRRSHYLSFIVFLCLLGCVDSQKETAAASKSLQTYLDFTDRDDQFTGGIKMIPISTLWTIERFVDEVEQVRLALGLDRDNFYLLGQSWGGILAMEYALKHQDKLKGPSEFGMVGEATQKNRDVSEDLARITVPTLVIGATYDTMDPEHMEWMSEEVANGRFLLCPEGSHLAQYDDQKTFFQGLVRFIRDVDQGTF